MCLLLWLNRVLWVVCWKPQFFNTFSILFKTPYLVTTFQHFQHTTHNTILLWLNSMLWVVCWKPQHFNTFSILLTTPYLVTTFQHFQHTTHNTLFSHNISTLSAYYSQHPIVVTKEGVCWKFWNVLAFDVIEIVVTNINVVSSII